MLKPVNRMVSNTIVRKDLWVRFPPAAPLLPRCSAIPRDLGRCVDPRDLESDYVYLPGLYLGDGMLTLMPRKQVWKLRIFQDMRYTRLILAGEHAMAKVSGRRVGRATKIGCVDSYCHWKHWICVFPQHGVGPKHLRRIVLPSWQRNLIHQFPHEFVKGLIESDGCRITNFAVVRGKRYEYPRYFFSNHSLDIQQLFRDACDLIGIEYRQDGPWNISVARRASVAALDEFIGPKG